MVQTSNLNSNLKIVTLFPWNSVAGGNLNVTHLVSTLWSEYLQDFSWSCFMCFLCLSLWEEPVSKSLADLLLCMQVLWCELLWRIETILCWWMTWDEASNFSENLVMLTLLWLSEGKRPATFRHIVVYIARCLFLGLSWSSFFACFFFSICVVSYFSQDILTLLLVLGLWPVGARKRVSKSNLVLCAVDG